eukprot:TRINITY_DN28115_c0_g1_i2.p1 TRINITY_DN28115_c0_g1~~TRINITY_DN28115_c0_g1_i2.p1  ORF type:complete len:102 (+),score=52.29 TRINITY_DN28115_c0_g1_i2:100-405(+)
MIRRPPRSTQSRSSAASDVYKRQNMATAANKVPELSVLEEDDEFEEFDEPELHADSGLVRTESSIAPKWQDSWDDEDVEDNFIDQLRSELKASSTKMETDK